MQSTTSTSSKVSVGTGSTAVLTANAGRKGIILSNDSDADLYLAFGAAAVMNEGVLLSVDGVLKLDSALMSTQAINAISAAGTKNLAFTEFF